MSDIEKYNLKHHKDFHGIQFQNFKIKERNLIFALCYKLLEQENNIIEFDVREIAKITNYKPTKAGDNIYRSLEEAYTSIKNASIYIKKANGVKHFVLFTVFETFEDLGIVKIKVNDEYRYLLNQVTAPFTIQNLLEYTNLKSGYTQLLYSLLKEWEKIKVKKWTVEEFRTLLGVPQKYRMSEIDKRVLNPALQELPYYFHNLKLEKIKIGRKITHLKFTWSNKKEDIKEAELIEIAISEKINNAIDKAKKNRFIAKLLSDDNIKVLVEKFDEKDLIKGLLWAYKGVKKDISSLNYLIKSIKTGAEETEKKVVIKKEKIIHKEEQLKIDKIISEDLGEVSEKELEEARKLYLEKTNTKSFTGVHEKIFNSTKVNYIKEVRDIETSKENKKESTIIEIKEKFKLEEIGQSRTEYLKQLKELEFNLILSNDLRVEDFKLNFIKFTQLIDMLENNYDYLNKQIIEKINDELNNLKTYFDTFLEKSEETEILELTDISEDRLLSKKGTPLFGGALVSRLEVVAKELKQKIRYKDKIIG